MTPVDAATAQGEERQALAATAEAVGVSLSDAQIAQLQSYLDLLERWNATYNLTSVRGRVEMRTQHLADCLAVIGPLRRHARAGTLLDVGSGGGLPGVIIAVALPGWQVSCVEAVGKKAAFLRQASGLLRLGNLRVEQARVGALQGTAFDVVTARAFATLADLVRVTGGLLVPGGVWMAMKGRVPDAEIADLPIGIEVFHVEPIAVPGLDAQRCLVWMRRRAEDDR